MTELKNENEQLRLQPATAVWNKRSCTRLNQLLCHTQLQLRPQQSLIQLLIGDHILVVESHSENLKIITIIGARKKQPQELTLYLKKTDSDHYLGEMLTMKTLFFVVEHF